MSKKCFVKFKFINAFKGSLAFKRALQELGISEEGLEIESYEQLSSKIISLLSKLLSEQQAFFSLYGTDSFASIDNVDLKGQFLSKPALAQAVKEKEAKLAADLKKLFDEAESGNGSIDLILSKFITNDILSVVLDKLDHYEKNKHKYRGPIASAVEGYLIKTLNWLSIALEDEKAKGTGERVNIKNDIHQAIRRINQYLNNQVKFAFPLYVQLPFGAIAEEAYIDNFYVDSTEDETSEMVANPIDREITQSIISIQEEKLRKGSIESFGIARAYNEGGKTIFKLYRAVLSEDKIIYTEVINKYTGENSFDPKKGELFKPDINKVSPFSIDGEADFTNFISNFDGIIPKRVGDKSIPEHNPEDLEIHISKNVSVDNNAEIQASINSVMDSIRGGKGSIFSSMPVFLKGRERYIDEQQPVTEYRLENGELIPVQVPFEGLVTKGLNTNIDIILFTTGEKNEKTFVGDYDPMNYVKVTATGAEPVKLETLEDPDFITRYFSLPPGIRVNNLTLKEALMEDLTAFYDGNKEMAANKMSIILGTHKKVVPLQFIQTLVAALDGKGLPTRSEIFIDQTVQSFKNKVQIVRAAEAKLAEAIAEGGKNKNGTNKVKEVTTTAAKLGLKQHKLEIFPNINQSDDNYSDSFDFGGEFNGVKVISWKQSDGTIKLEFLKGDEFVFTGSTEYNELVKNVNSILSRQENYIASDQVTLLYYSGTASNKFIPMFLSLKPADRDVSGDFYFSSMAEIDMGGKTSNIRVTLPVSKSETGESYIGGFSNKSLLKMMNLKDGRYDIGEDLPDDFPFNILGLLFENEAQAKAFANVSDNVVNKELLTKALTAYYFKFLEKFIPENKRVRTVDENSEVIAILNQTFLSPTDEELGLNEESKKALGLKSRKKVTTRVNLYNNADFIKKRMALVAEAIKSLKEKEVFSSVVASDFKNNTAMQKLRHNIDVTNPIHRVLKFEIDPASKLDKVSGELVDDIEIDADDDLFSQLAKEVTYEGDRQLADLEERRRFLDKVAGTRAVENIDKVEERLKTLQGNNIPLGVVMDSIVYMNEELATQGNFYHEAAHRVFDYLLTREEKAFYLSEARKLPYTQERINTFLEGRNLPNTKENVDLFYREQIMNLFAQYRLDRDNASFLTNLGYWLKDLFDTILDWLNISKDPSLNQLFRDMDKGAYRNRTAGKTEPLFQNLITKELPLDTEATENLFYHLYGSLINDKAYSKHLEDYKLTRKISFLRDFIDKVDSEVRLNLSQLKEKVLPEVLNDLLKFKDNINENVYMFKEFIDERVFEQNFKPEEDLSEEFSEDELLAQDINEDPEETPKDTGFNKSKYNEEVFLEPKVKTFINTIVSKEPYKLGLATKDGKDVLKYVPIYKKVNNRLINKAQKDFSVAPLGGDKIQHFMVFLEGFSRYDTDYAKLLKAITLQFEVTKEGSEYVVGRNKAFLLGLVKNFSQNRIYYSKVINKKGGKKADVFGALEEQELILDKNANRLNNLLSKIGRVPDFKNVNILTYNKGGQDIIVYKHGNDWIRINWVKGQQAHEEVTADEALNIYDTIFTDLNHDGFTTMFDDNLSKIQDSLKTYKSSNNLQDLDNAVYGFKMLFSLIGMPVNSSYAYMVALNSLDTSVEAGKIDFLGAFLDLSKIFKDTSKDSFAQFFSEKFKRNHPSITRYINKMKEQSDTWFHAMINGSNLSYNSVKGVDGKSYYAYSYNNITSQLEMSEDKRFATNNILRVPYFRIANMMVNQGIKKEFKNLDEHEIFSHLVALYKKGFYNLDQLEANSTNFSVKGDKKSYIKFNKVNASYEVSNPTLGSDLAEQYRDVAASMDELIKIYEEAQDILNEVNTDEDRQELLDYINEKYDLTLGVSALTLSDLDKSIITDRAYNKLGFNTFFNLVPVVQLKTKAEVLEYIELVNTKAFEDNLIKIVFGSSKGTELSGLAYNIWKEAVADSKAMPQSSIKLDPYTHRVFIADMTANYLVQTHKIYKKILGEKYFHAFKSANTGEFNKRLKALAIFGQDMDQATYIEVDDVLERLDNIDPKNWKEDYAYTTGITTKGKGVLESTDGAGLITFERAIQVQKSKSRLDDGILSYYVSLITDGRYIYEGDVQASTVTSLNKTNKYARKANAVNGLFKTALGSSIADKFRYHKMAYVALPRDMYQRPKADTTEEQLAAAYLDVAKATVAWLEDYSKFQAKNAAYETLYALLEAIPGQERVFNIYKNMETKNIQGSIFRSASKAYKTDNEIKIPYGAEKHQTENTNFKQAISKATQAAAGITSDQGEVPVWNGEGVTSTKQVIEDFIQSNANISNDKAAILLGMLIKDGKPNVEMLSYYLKKYVAITRNKEHLEGLFDISYHKGVPKFNTTPDNPEAIAILLTLVAKIINDINTSHLKGDAYGLVPPVFYSVQEDAKGYVPLKYRTSEGRTLQPRQLMFNGTWNILPFTDKQKAIDLLRGNTPEEEFPIMEVHEMVIPAHETWQQEYLIDRERMRQGLISKFELDLKYPIELFLVYGTRIPHEEKRSGAVGLVVDFFPPHMGSFAMIATAKMAEDGHDNDNDKLYTYKAFTEKVDGVWRVKRTPSQTLWNKVKNNSFLKQKIEKELSADVKHINNIREIEEAKSNINYYQEMLLPLLKENLILEPLVEDTSLSQKELYRSTFNQIKTKFEESLPELLDAGFEGISDDQVITVSDILEYYEDNLNNLEASQKQFNQRKSRLITEAVRDVTKFSAEHGFDTSIDSEVEQNKILFQFMALHSNRYTLEEGLTREQTDLEHAVNWTKNELKRTDQTFGFEVLGSPIRISKNIFKSVEGGQGISINAKFIKTLHDLKQMGARFSKLSLVKKSVNNVNSSNRFVKAGKEYVKKLNELIQKQNETRKDNEKLSLIDTSVEEYKRNNLKGSLYVSISTDAIKNQFGRGLNLNKMTYAVYALGIAFNIPQAMLMTLCTNSYIREFTSLKQMEEAHALLSKGKGKDVEGKKLRTPPLTMDDLLDLYSIDELENAASYSDYVFNITINEKGVKVPVLKLQPDGNPVLNSVGMLKLQALTLILRLNKSMAGLFTIGSIINSDKSQQIDSHLMTTSLLSSPWDSTDEFSPTIAQYLGVESTKNYADIEMGIEYTQAIAPARVNAVKMTALVMQLFKPYLDMDKKDNIAFHLSQMIGAKNQDYLWFSNMSTIIHNANAKYDVTKLKELKTKLDQLNLEHKSKILLINKLKWENGIFYIDKEDTKSEDIVTVQQQLGNLPIKDFEIIAELLKATRYIYGWKEADFSPINYFPGSIIKRVNQERSAKVEDYVPELERQLLLPGSTIKVPYFQGSLPIPVKGGAVEDSYYLDKSFNNSYLTFKLTNLPVGTDTFKYMSKGTNIYKRLSLTDVSNTDGSKRKAAVYSLLRKPRPALVSQQSFNPFFQSRITNLDVFRMEAKKNEVSIEDIPYVLIYNNYLLMDAKVKVRQKDGITLLEKFFSVPSMEKSFLGKLTSFNYTVEEKGKETIKKAEIGIMRNFKKVDKDFSGTLRSFWKNTIFNEMGTESGPVGVFEAETNFPQNKLIKIQNGQVTILEDPSLERIENTFLRAPFLATATSNLDVYDMVEGSKEQDLIEGAFTGHVDQEMFGPNDVMVFGTNESGFHGQGIAALAYANTTFNYRKWNPDLEKDVEQKKVGDFAIAGKTGLMEGTKGFGYGLVTVSAPGVYLDDKKLRKNIKEFYKVAKQNSSKRFIVPYNSDNNLNGKTLKDLAVLFGELTIPENVVFGDKMTAAIVNLYGSLAFNEKLSSLEGTLEDDITEETTLEKPENVSQEDWDMLSDEQKINYKEC